MSVIGAANSPILRLTPHARQKPATRCRKPPQVHPWQRARSSRESRRKSSSGCASLFAKQKTWASASRKSRGASITVNPRSGRYAVPPRAKSAKNWPRKESPWSLSPASWTTTVCNKRQKENTPAQRAWPGGGVLCCALCAWLRVKRRAAPLHDAATVFARAGVDFDLVADVAEQRNSHFETGGQFGGLQNLAGRIALDGGFRVVDDAHHVGGQFDRNGATVVEHDFHGHAFFQIVQCVAHVVGFDFVLVVLFVHEDVHRVRIVGIRAFLAVQQHNFKFLVGLVDGLAGGTGEQVLELQLNDGGVTAGLVVFGLLDDERVGTDHDHVADAQFLCGFHKLRLLRGMTAPP